MNEDKFRYTGSSMLPTFKPGQVLYVRPMVESPRPGDVVVYKSGKQIIVHRVKALQANGFITRGDNNPRDDTPIKPQQIIGIVKKVDDWGRPRSVMGGRRGLWLAQLRWILQALYTNSLPWLGAPYRWLKARRWAGRIWQPHITTVQLQTQDGPMIKYVVLGKTVATWQPELKRFLCRRPYDLIIFPPE